MFSINLEDLDQPTKAKLGIKSILEFFLLDPPEIDLDSNIITAGRELTEAAKEQISEEYPGVKFQ